MNITKIFKIGAGLVTAAVGSIVAIKAGKTPKTAAEGDSADEIIEDEELAELAAECECATPDEEEPAEEEDES